MSDQNVSVPAKGATWRWPTIGEVAALSRYVSAGAGTLIAGAVALHVFTNGQAAIVQKAIDEFGSGVVSIVGAVSALAAVGSAVYGVLKSSPLSRLLSTARNPDVARVVMKDPAVAAAITETKVVSQ